LIALAPFFFGRLAAEAVYAAHGAGAGLKGEGGGEGNVEIEIGCLGRFGLEVVFFLEKRVRCNVAWTTTLF
jgi:hypothetical protein